MLVGSNSSEFDAQIIELLGRNRLVSDLLSARLEVAFPARDRGVDLIAYVDLACQTSKFVAVPIQMKAASHRVFSVDRKYSKISNLVIAFVWQLGDPGRAVTYALSYREAVKIAAEMGWTNTDSWGNGKYSTSAPSKKLCALLEPYKMSPERWRERIFANQRR
jgi:hypothetical protein